MIYHLNDSNVPNGLYTSKNWPVFWIESITNSPLSKFTTSEIVNCILYNEDEKQDQIYLQVFKQIYHDIIINYDVDIDNDTIEKILIHIIEILRSENKLDVNTFKKLVNKLKSTEIKNSYKSVNIKKDFVNCILNENPYLQHLIRFFILNFDLINKKKLNKR